MYRLVKKNDPRYDPSSVSVFLENEEVEVESISYGDTLTVSEVRAPGARYAVGASLGPYRADETEMTLHLDVHQRLLDRLRLLAGDPVITKRQFTITVSYSEVDSRTNQLMPNLTDTLRGCIYLGTKRSPSAGGGDPLKVTARIYVWRIEWHNGVRLA